MKHCHMPALDPCNDQDIMAMQWLNADPLSGLEKPCPVITCKLSGARGIECGTLLQMAPSITEAQRRETLLELLENTLKPRKAAASLGMDLIEPVRPSGGQQARGTKTPARDTQSMLLLLGDSLSARPL